MFWALKPGCIDWSVGFRDSIGDGITPGQKNRKQELVSTMQKVLDDEPMEYVGPNEWAGDAKPTFSLVTLAPKQIGVDARIYDSMILRPGDWYRLKKNRQFIMGLEKRTSTFLTFCDLDYRAQPDREVSFFGIREGVEKAKAQLRMEL